MEKYLGKDSFCRRIFAISKKKPAQTICVFLVLLLVVLIFVFSALGCELSMTTLRNRITVTLETGPHCHRKDGADYVAALGVAKTGKTKEP